MDAVHQIRNEVVGKEPFEVELEAGSFYWGDHLAFPIVHKVKRFRVRVFVFVLSFSASLLLFLDARTTLYQGEK